MRESSFARYVLPNMYYYREQINSLSAVHASAAPAIRAFVGERERRSAAGIAGLPRSRARSSTPDQS